MNGVARDDEALGAAQHELVRRLLQLLSDGLPVAHGNQRLDDRRVETPHDDVAAARALGELQYLQIDQLVVFQAGGPAHASKYSKPSNQLHGKLQCGTRPPTRSASGRWYFRCKQE